MIVKLDDQRTYSYILGFRGKVGTEASNGCPGVHGSTSLRSTGIGTHRNRCTSTFTSLEWHR